MSCKDRYIDQSYQTNKRLFFAITIQVYIYIYILLYQCCFLFSEAVEALWTLSFDESIQAAIIHDPECQVITTFVKLYKCSKDNDLRKICCEALWTMNNSLKKSLYHKKVGKFKFEKVLYM